MHTGVYFSLRGVVYANNSNIHITEIGETDYYSNNGLQCITDRRPCCYTRPNRFGEWYFPGGTTTVPTLGGATSFYRNRGDNGTVNLNRVNANVMMPTGLFCCVVPNATGVMQKICANIGPGKSMITAAVAIIFISYSYSCKLDHNYWGILVPWL